MPFKATFRQLKIPLLTKPLVQKGTQSEEVNCHYMQMT